MAAAAAALLRRVAHGAGADGCQEALEPGLRMEICGKNLKKIISMSSYTTLNGVIAIFRNGRFMALGLPRKVEFSTSAHDDLMGFDGINNGILPLAIV